MKRIVIFICLLTVQSLMIFSCQTAGDSVTRAEYLNDFDWMVKTFTENDAGFKYYLEAKGVKDYTRHTEACRKKIGRAKSESEFLSLMNEWLFYFRKHHIGVCFKEADRLTEAEKDSIRTVYRNEEIINLSEADFLRYLKENSNILHPIEGIWTSPSCEIGIIRSFADGQRFDAFIIKADSIYWMPGQKKAELMLQPDGTFHVAYKGKNHVKAETCVKWLGGFERGNLYGKFLLDQTKSGNKLFCRRFSFNSFTFR